MRWLLVRWANNKAQNGRKCWHPIDFSFLLGSDLLLCIRKLVECDCPKKKGEGRCYTNCTYPFNFQLKLTGAPPKEIKIITRPLYSNGLRDRSITHSQGVHVFVNVYISPNGRIELIQFGIQLGGVRTCCLSMCALEYAYFLENGFKWKRTPFLLLLIRSSINYNT